MSDGTGDMKLLALIDPDTLFNFMSSLVAKYLVWEINLNNTLVAVQLANGTVVHSSGVANGLILSGVWQAYMTFLVLDILFEVILSMPCLIMYFSMIRLGNKRSLFITKGSSA